MSNEMCPGCGSATRHYVSAGCVDELKAQLAEMTAKYNFMVDSAQQNARERDTAEAKLDSALADNAAAANFALELENKLAIARDALERILGTREYNVSKEPWKTIADDTLAKICEPSGPDTSTLACGHTPICFECSVPCTGCGRPMEDKGAEMQWCPRCAKAQTEKVQADPPCDTHKEFKPHCEECGLWNQTKVTAKDSPEEFPFSMVCSNCQCGLSWHTRRPVPKCPECGAPPMSDEPGSGDNL